jgi:hypothetical protein
MATAAERYGARIPSERRSGWGRGTVEDCCSIDVNRLHREGCLTPGWSRGWQWIRNGKKLASITLHADADRLHLSYRVRIYAGEWEDVEETVRVVRVSCRFGGARPYFICPGVVNGVACSRRVGKLCSPGRYFLCRHCYRLAYQSQREQPFERALRRVNKIRLRLGGDPGMLSPLPEKPKGTHWRTFARMLHQVRRAEGLATEHLAILRRKLAGGTGGTGLAARTIRASRSQALLDPNARGP